MTASWEKSNQTKNQTDLISGWDLDIFQRDFSPCQNFELQTKNWTTAWNNIPRHIGKRTPRKSNLTKICSTSHHWFTDLGNWYKIATKAEPLRSQFIFVGRDNKYFVQSVRADWVSWISILWIFPNKYFEYFWTIVLNVFRQIFWQFRQIFWKSSKHARFS